MPASCHISVGNSERTRIGSYRKLVVSCQFRENSTWQLQETGCQLSVVNLEIIWTGSYGQPNASSQLSVKRNPNWLQVESASGCSCFVAGQDILEFRTRTDSCLPVISCLFRGHSNRQLEVESTSFWPLASYGGKQGDRDTRLQLLGHSRSLLLAPAQTAAHPPEAYLQRPQVLERIVVYSMISGILILATLYLFSITTDVSLLQIIHV